MSSDTPILPCLDFSSIEIHPSSSSAHPLDSPSFDIPSSILQHLQTASNHLHNHETVALPTETVYGLAASSLDSEACKAIYRIKNRPADNPLIIHVSSLDMLRTLLPNKYEISELYMELITSFWPGPLSLLFPSINRPPLPAPQTNAIRMPSHPLSLALIHYSNLPLSAPSANSSGRPSPTKAEHVYNDLNKSKGLGCILDGGDCGVGVESTVINGLNWVKGGGGSVDILRPGGLGIERIKEIVDKVDGKEGLTEILLHGKPWKSNQKKSDGIPNGGTAIKGTSISGGKVKPVELSAPSTPGLKYRHYSPRVPVYLLQPNNIFPRPTNLPEEAESSSQAILRQISRRVHSSHGKGKKRIGFLYYENSPLSEQITKSTIEQDEIQLIPLSLGIDSTSAAQRLFAGMLTLERIPPDDQIDKIGVDAIMIEGCSDAGLGLAVMERVSKAVGGGGILGDVKDGQGEIGVKGESMDNTFWVDLASRI
ncbi:Sua5/YciO/YrdC/YwlC family tRNA threonylcarbamoyl adenosine modification protein [Kwoniella pini CBS 10737]|uniref:Threonylcarbamoyl-AMP synthase n=1 Tax=Kwoniella pini CBS 10737 TaxID=1296096 RepID=A0A1B9IA06_9TREE|nr:Sua5/YciO/YrdC/YwlC family protein [Kwoniella pini CBS 10737]OCF52452.1 Sua5/YciO/YrdC/YwlC family protein [Kwoniella pini CBS 10737]